MNAKMKELGNVLERANELFEEMKNGPEVQEAKRGNIVTVAGIEWIVLKVEGSKVFCITKDFDSTSTKFDSNSNNWDSSDLRNYLNTKFYKKISSMIGAGNILPIETNMLSLDGQTEYGECKDKVSLLTVDLYRENRDILPNTDKWWWLVTPWSTPHNDYTTSVCVVSPLGFINNNNCNDLNAVRPFCIFDSSIFESEDD
jgi:hypothetical protein